MQELTWSKKPRVSVTHSSDRSSPYCNTPGFLTGGCKTWHLEQAAPGEIGGSEEGDGSSKAYPELPLNTVQALDSTLSTVGRYEIRFRFFTQD